MCARDGNPCFISSEMKQWKVALELLTTEKNYLEVLKLVIEVVLLVLFSSLSFAFLFL